MLYVPGTYLDVGFHPLDAWVVHSQRLLEKVWDVEEALLLNAELLLAILASFVRSLMEDMGDQSRT